MECKCLICDEAFPESSSRGGPQSNSKKSRSDSKSRNTSAENTPLISDAKTKFALTNSQYVILQKVLSLPVGVCKAELTNGPYCRDCFTHINNVCHIMSALENLQESVQEFRKDFGAKLKASFEAAGGLLGLGTRGKRKSPGMSLVLDGDYGNTRQTILDCLKSSIRFASHPSKDTDTSKPKKNFHEVIKKMDPDGSPDTEVSADMVVRTTNGDMPTLSRRSAAGGGRSNSTVAVVVTEAGAKKWSGQKPFHCPHCRSTFYKQSSLKDHLKSTHKQKQEDEEIATEDYICWYCKATFHTDEELQDHEVSHKESKTCPICLKQFTRTNTLNRHILTHAAQKKKKVRNTFNCDSCSKVFYSKKVLKSHKSKMHRKEKLVIKFPSSSPKKTLRAGRCKICSRIVPDLEGHMKSTHPEEKTFTSTKINGNGSNISKTSAEHAVREPVKLKAGPASWKLKAKKLSVVKKKDLSLSPPPPTLIAEGSFTNEDLGSADKPSDCYEDRYPAYSKGIEEEKTESSENDSNITKNSPISLPHKEQKNKENNFLSAATKMIRPPPPPPEQQSSKYQFKNLLKIGDADK